MSFCNVWRVRILGVDSLGSGLFCSHWAFPIVFVVVVVVVVLVEFERGSGPVSGFGCTRSLFGMQLCCFSGNIV